MGEKGNSNPIEKQEACHTTSNKLSDIMEDNNSRIYENRNVLCRCY